METRLVSRKVMFMYITLLILNKRTVVKIYKLKNSEYDIAPSESYINAREREGWRMMEKISRIDRVRNEVLLKVKKERKNYPTYSKKKEG